MFNQQNYQAICEMTKGLETIPNKNPTKPLYFKTFDPKEADGGSSVHPGNVYADVGFKFAEEVLIAKQRPDSLMISTIPENFEKNLSPKQEQLVRDLLTTWSKDR